jgi:lipoprotein-anchoring transpeptidase ErfK/SrfK
MHMLSYRGGSHWLELCMLTVSTLGYNGLGGAGMAMKIDISLNNYTLKLKQNGRIIRTYPVAIGKMATRTPGGSYRIINKVPNPGGPFGAFWMGLSRKHYGIHGTNAPSSIGKSVSHGCIRMNNRDVLELAKLVPLQTVVTIHP